jgi:hypothetical protein
VVQFVRLGGLGRLYGAAPCLLLALFISFSQQELLLLRERKSSGGFPSGAEPPSPLLPKD